MVATDLAAAPDQLTDGDMNQLAPGTPTYTYADAPWIYGTDGDDILNGDQYGENDHIFGLGGNDHLYGGIGDDWLEGGLGNDYLDGSGGLDIASYAYAAYGVHASLAAGTSFAINSAVADNDTLLRLKGLSGSAHGDVFEGNAIGNLLEGLGGDDLLYGYAGGDILDGGEGTDWLFGGAGNDVLKGGLGNDHLNGEGDRDTVSYAYSSEAMMVDLSQGVAHTVADANRDVDVLVNIESIAGTLFDDVLIGDDLDNSIDAGDGTNIIDARGGNNYVIAGQDQDFITAGAGNDVIYGLNGNDIIRGGGGNDMIDAGNGNDVILPAYPGNACTSVIHGGGGEDTLILLSPSGSEIYDLGSGFAYSAGINVTFDGIEDATGGQFNDQMVGSDVANHLVGNSGQDMLHGLGGADWLEGGNGNDHLVGGAGADLLSGGAGADEVNGGADYDTASYLSSQSAVTIDLAAGTGTTGDAVGDQLISIEGMIGSRYGDTLRGTDALAGDTISGQAGNDHIFGRAGDDHLTGELGDDVIQGDDGRDVILGFEGNDSLSGGNQADYLRGDEGRDTLAGGNGDDRLDGGYGMDILAGGAGNDTFEFNTLYAMGNTATTRDLIQDFARGADHVLLHATDANTGLIGDQDFHFIGKNAFTGQAGQLHYAFSGTSTVISGDVNGDGKSDFQIELQGNINLTASDFVL